MFAPSGQTGGRDLGVGHAICDHPDDGGDGHRAAVIVVAFRVRGASAVVGSWVAIDAGALLVGLFAYLRLLARARPA